MKSVRVYLWVMGFLLVSAVGAVCYVWFVYQDVYRDDVTSSSVVREEESATASSEYEEIVDGTETVSPTEAAPSPESPVLYTVDITTLPASQQAILKAFHGDSDTLTITAEMYTCAETGVGGARLQEILNGSAPSPREALTLAQCLR